MTSLLTAKSARRKLAYTKPNTFYTTITFNPPKIDDSKRAPLDIAVALDNSGSMEERTYRPGFGNYSNSSLTKLDAAKIALRKLIDFLSPEDRLTFVTFTTSASLRFSGVLTPSGKSEALRALDQVRSQDSTALNDGLQLALREVIARARYGAIQRVLIFTDGQANKGICDAEGISADAARTIGPNKIGISSFGFGTNHDSGLLRGIVRDGAFYFIDDVEMIPTAFGTELGSLTSIYARDVTLNITSGPMVEHFEVVNDLQSTGQTIKCHDLLAEQPYTVVLRVTTKESHKKIGRGTMACRLFNIEATLNDLRLDTTIAVKAALDVEFTTTRYADKTDDEAVAKDVAVQIAAKAQREAQKHADRGDMASARTVLTDASSVSASLGNKTMETILRTQACDGYASSTSYAMRGRSMSASLDNTLSRQTAGTGGSVVGGVDVDAVFANPVQTKVAGTFSIKVKRSTP